jgi:hypothetical protein
MAQLPDDITLAIWGLTWIHLDSTLLLRKRHPQMFHQRWWPYWNLLHRNAMTLALWGDHSGWPAVACHTHPPPLWLHRPLPFPQLPSPPPFTHVVNGDIVVCVVRGCLWMGTVRRILQNTTPHLGRWRRLSCGDFTLVQIDGNIFWWQHSSACRVTSWSVL